MENREYRFFSKFSSATDGRECLTLPIATA